MIKRSLLFTYFIASVIAVSIAQEKRTLTPMDIAKLEMVGEMTLSPQGDLIAYTVRVQADPMVENKPSRGELHLLNTSTGESRVFLTRGNVRAIAFRPNHKSITFLDRLDGDKTTSLYEISLTGGEATNIVSFETSISSYEWSPSGKEIAFTAREPRPVEKASLPYQPEIYEGNLVDNKAYVVAPGEEVRQIKMDGHLSLVRWSPDEMKLAVYWSPTSLVDDFYMKRKISIVNAASLESGMKIDHSAKLGDIQWSTDGKNLALIAGAHINDPIDGRLWIISAESGKILNVNPSYEGKFDAISWKDANTVEFIASKGAHSVFGSVRKDGTGFAETITQSQPILHSFTRSGDQYAFVADSPEHPAEIYTKKGMGKLTRATNSNPWMKDISFAKQEVIQYKAQDGLMIEGILIRPLNEEPGKRYPLVTVVHGGPESHYDNSWITGYSTPGQVAAADGFAVFYPNYRGSTGRGLEFCMSSQGDLAGKEFDDVVDGVDYLIEMGLVDGSKVGVTGGSYGGYATGWLCTKYTDRFAAGVMFVGISDNISKWGTSDIPEELYLVHSRKRIWEDYQFFLERSPIYYADQTKSPMLIAAGKEDTRVHPSQSIELYRHIKTRTNTPVQLVLYPGEGHGNANSTARYDYSMRQMQWFKDYLQEKVIKP